MTNKKSKKKAKSERYKNQKQKLTILAKQTRRTQKAAVTKRKQKICQLAGNYQTKSLIIHATVISNSEKPATYIKLTKNNFQTRSKNSTPSFQECHKMNNTELSKHTFNA